MTQSAVETPEDNDGSAVAVEPVSSDDAATTFPEPAVDPSEFQSVDPSAADTEPEPEPEPVVKTGDTVLLAVQGNGFDRYFNLPNASGDEVLRLGPTPVEVDADAAVAIINAAAANGVSVYVVSTTPGDAATDTSENEVQA